MDLFKRGGCRIGFDKTRTADLRIADSAGLIASCNPEQFGLEQRAVSVSGIVLIFQHLADHIDDIRIGNLFIPVDVYPAGHGYAAGEDVVVEIHLLKTGEHRLPVLEHSKAGPDLCNVVFAVLQIVQNQRGKVDIRIVIDFAVEIFSGQRAVTELLLCLLTLQHQGLHLFPGKPQIQLADIVQRVADLIHNPQGNQDIRRQNRIQMRMKIGAELAFGKDECFDNRLPLISRVILGLRHQCLGNRRNRSLHLDRSVGIHISHLGIGEAEHIHEAIVGIIVARHSAVDDQKVVLILAQREIAELCKIADEVSGTVVRCSQGIKKLIAVHEKIDDDVFFLIEIEPSESLFHSSRPFFRSLPACR